MPRPYLIDGFITCFWLVVWILSVFYRGISVSPWQGLNKAGLVLVVQVDIRSWLDRLIQDKRGRQSVCPKTCSRPFCNHVCRELWKVICLRIKALQIQGESSDARNRPCFQICFDSSESISGQTITDQYFFIIMYTKAVHAGNRNAVEAATRLHTC